MAVRRILRLFAVVALTCFVARDSWSQATATVRPDDPVYEFIDRLLGAGLVDTVIVGQRPMSRQEIGRILDEAWSKKENAGWLSKSLELYRAAYRQSDGPTLRSLSGEDVTAWSPPRGIPTDGNGAIDVALNPLLANQLGQMRADGRTFALAVAGEVPITSWLVGAASARVGQVSPWGSDAASFSRVDQAYARALFDNVAITVGRDYVVLGQGMHGGLTNSINPHGFDMVRVSSERPFVLPWLLHLLGPVSGTAFLADLGETQNFPHARLFNWKISARPSSALEIGASIADQVGGQGAPGGTFAQKAEDAFPLLDATILHRNFLFSNKFFGVDARWRVPNARGLQLYMDGAIDDFDLRRLKSSLTEDGGYIWGASFACFSSDGCGSTKVTSEYHVTGLRFFTHGIFKSGYTLDHEFIGDQLGPRGKAAYLNLDIDRIDRHFTIEMAHEIRSGDTYGATSSTSNDSDFRFVLLQHYPAERRWRTVATFSAGHPTSRATTQLSAGIERVEHFNFQPGAWRTNSLIRLMIVLRPAQRQIGQKK